jgi:VIT1/CCC1 family predicted Fe2+/Mn2+ transporter
VSLISKIRNLNQQKKADIQRIRTYLYDKKETIKTGCIFFGAFIFIIGAMFLIVFISFILYLIGK